MGYGRNVRLTFYWLKVFFEPIRIFGGLAKLFSTDPSSQYGHCKVKALLKTEELYSISTFNELF